MTSSVDGLDEKNLTLLDLSAFLRSLGRIRFALFFWMLPAAVLAWLLVIRYVGGIPELDGITRDALGRGLVLGAIQAGCYALGCWLLVSNSNALFAFRRYAGQARNARSLFRHGTSTGCVILTICFAAIAVESKNPFLVAMNIAVSVAYLMAALSVLKMEKVAGSLFGPDSEPVLGFITSLANERDCRKLPPPANLKGGIKYALGALLCSVAILILPRALADMLPMVGIYLIIRAKYFFQPTLDPLLHFDSRPPVLFLRSFKEDQKVKFWSLKFASSSVSEGTLEQRLSRNFGARGPFIAVGDPDGSLVLGAVRTTLSNDEWQDRVVGWMQAASAIVLIAGTTRWVDWELKKILDLRDVSKLVLVFPPARKRFRSRAEAEAALHLKSVQAAFEGTIWQSSLSELEHPLQIRALVFKPEGGIAVVTSSSRGLNSYEWAAFVAHYWQNQLSPVPFRAECHDRRAPSRSRLIAVLLDVIFLAGICAPFALAAAYRHFDLFTLAFIASAVLLAIAYPAVCEGIWGATVGKVLAGVQVVKDDGTPLGFRLAASRILLRFLDAYYRGVREAVTSTLVIKRQTSIRLRAAMTLLWLATISAGAYSALRLYEAAPAWIFAPADFKAVSKQMVANSTGDLRAGNLRFVENRGGSERSSSTYQPGDQVAIQYDLVGYGRDVGGKPDLQFSYIVSDSEGSVIAEVSPNWFKDNVQLGDPVEGSFVFSLLNCAPGGRYGIGVDVRDELRKADLQFKVGFDVDDSASTSCRLEIRGLQLSNPGEATTDSIPNLSVGDSVQMKCELVGLELRNHRLNARMGLRVLDPNGKVVIEQPDYGIFNQTVSLDATKVALPVSGPLTIPRTFATGTYVEQYTVTDNVSGQTATADARFDVK